MNAIDLLNRHHVKARRLFERIRNAETRNEKEQRFEELADHLVAHTTIEEHHFYPAAFGPRTQDLLAEAIADHRAMRQFISDILALPHGDDTFDMRVRLLEDEVDRHTAEEEDLFVIVQRRFSDEFLTSLGAELLAAYESERWGEPVPSPLRTRAVVVLH